MLFGYCCYTKIIFYDEFIYHRIQFVFGSFISLQIEALIAEMIANNRENYFLRFKRKFDFNILLAFCCWVLNDELKDDWLQTHHRPTTTTTTTTAKSKFGSRFDWWGRQEANTCFFFSQISSDFISHNIYMYIRLQNLMGVLVKHHEWLVQVYSHECQLELVVINSNFVQEIAKWKKK